VGLGFLLVGLGFFSLWIPLWLAKYVTTEWTDPVDIRPSDFVSIFKWFIEQPSLLSSQSYKADATGLDPVKKPTSTDSNHSTVASQTPRI